MASPRRRKRPAGEDDRGSFGVLGVLRYTYKDPDQPRPRVNYERRVLLVRARTEAEARRSAQRSFRSSEGKSWASPGCSLKVEYLGTERVEDFLSVEDGEVWWEFVDRRPRLEGARRRRARKRERA